MKHAFVVLAVCLSTTLFAQPSQSTFTIERTDYWGVVGADGIPLIHVEWTTSGVALSSSISGAGEQDNNSPSSLPAKVITNSRNAGGRSEYSTDIPFGPNAPNDNTAKFALNISATAATGDTATASIPLSMSLLRSYFTAAKQLASNTCIDPGPPQLVGDMFNSTNHVVRLRARSKLPISVQASLVAAGKKDPIASKTVALPGGNAWTDIPPIEQLTSDTSYVVTFTEVSPIVGLKRSPATYVLDIATKKDSDVPVPKLTVTGEPVIKQNRAVAFRADTANVHALTVRMQAHDNTPARNWVDVTQAPLRVEAKPGENQYLVNVPLDEQAEYLITIAAEPQNVDVPAPSGFVKRVITPRSKLYDKLVMQLADGISFVAENLDASAKANLSLTVSRNGKPASASCEAATCSLSSASLLALLQPPVATSSGGATATTAAVQVSISVSAVATDGSERTQADTFTIVGEGPKVARANAAEWNNLVSSAASAARARTAGRPKTQGVIDFVALLLQAFL